MKTLVLGLGNPILSDDAVGIRIARELKKELTDVDVVEASTAGFRIVDEIIGYDKLIIVDSIKTGKAKPGTLFKFNVSDFKETLHFSSPHDISFFDALEIMKKQNEKLPSQIDIYALEVKDTNNFSEKCTLEVETAIPIATREIIEDQRFKMQCSR